MNNQPRGELVPGGLAITLIDLPPVMSGSVVELESRIIKGDCMWINGVLMTANMNGWICNHDSVPGGCGYADSALMPINPSADPLEITQQMEEKV